MTRNKRYEAYYDAREQQRIAEAPPRPTTLPRQAYGPHPLVWAPRGAPLPVWAWISWPDRRAERIAARATGWNDRVVVVEWDSERGTINTVVWRGAVRHRATKR